MISLFIKTKIKNCKTNSDLQVFEMQAQDDQTLLRHNL